MRESEDGGLVVTEEEEKEWSKASEFRREETWREREREGGRREGEREGGGKEEGGRESERVISGCGRRRGSHPTLRANRCVAGDRQLWAALMPLSSIGRNASSKQSGNVTYPTQKSSTTHSQELHYVTLSSHNFSRMH